MTTEPHFSYKKSSTNNRQSVLIIEDSTAISAAICAFLEDELNIQYEMVDNFEDAKNLLANKPQRFFMAIVDLHLPDAAPDEVVDHVIARGVPPLILTADYSEDTKNRMMEKPVIDYVIKRNMGELWYVACVVERVRTNTTRKVLIVDDSPSCRLLLSTHLKRQRLRTLEASSGAEALEILKAHPDTLLVITDQYMPNMPGTELVSKIRSRFSRRQMGIIGMSSLNDRKIIAELLKAGANDFFLKPYCYEELFCRVAQNIDNMVNYQRLSDASIRDPLTGLYSHKHLMDISGMICNQVSRKQSHLVTIVFEILDLHDLVLAHGCAFYSEAIKHVSRVLLRCMRQTDIIARLDNDLFCVLCQTLVDDDAGKSVFKRVQTELNNVPLYVNDIAVFLAVRVGHHSSNSPIFSACIKQAHMALESDKTSTMDSKLA